MSFFFFRPAVDAEYVGRKRSSSRDLYNGTGMAYSESVVSIVKEVSVQRSSASSENALTCVCELPWLAGEMALSSVSGPRAMVITCRPSSHTKLKLQTTQQTYQKGFVIPCDILTSNQSSLCH